MVYVLKHQMFFLFQSFISSACIEHLDFLHTLPDPSIFIPVEEKVDGVTSLRNLTDLPQLEEPEQGESLDEQVGHTSCLGRVT